MSLPNRIDHLAVAQQYAANTADWPLAPRFNPSERWYHRMHVTSEYEVWLLTWLPGQGTDLHDHGGSAGGFTVVAGQLTEYTVAESPPRLHGTPLATGAGRRFGPHHIHQVTNNDPEPAVSVHVYSPALSRMTRYELGDGGLVRAAVDLAGSQW